MGRDVPKWGQKDVFPTNPDLADVLGRTDFDFESFQFLDFCRFPDFQTGPGPGLGWAWAWPGLGQAAPGLGQTNT